MMCRLLDVSTSGFYDWLDRPVSAGQQHRENLKVVIEQVFHDSGRTYGYRRICSELNRQVVEVDDELVRTLMRELGLTPVQVKRRKGLTVPDQQADALPDLLGREFTTELPGGAMVGDITQIDTAEGPLFLATVIDCFSKSIIGWSIDEQYPAQLVCAALDMAALRVPFPHGAVFHSDRGSQYTSELFSGTLSKHGIRQSVGRTGICYDNSMAESVFGKLKTESVHHHTFATRAEARQVVIKFIEGFYNRRRLHSGIGYRPPVAVLDEWFTHHPAA